VLILNLYLVKPLIVQSYANQFGKKAVDPKKATEIGSERRGFNNHHLLINSNAYSPVADSPREQKDGPFQASHDLARCWNQDINSSSNVFGQEWHNFGRSQFARIERNTGNQKTTIKESNITQNMNIYCADPN
jgi:hypothetical protein